MGNVYGSGVNLPLLRVPNLGDPPGVLMSMLEFYDYLVSSEATHDLALSIADVWADRTLPILERAS